ncbi:MAG: GNAT family N-acetyltransferase [Acidimicrobiales bacterium]
MSSALAIRGATPADFDAWFALYDEVAAEGRWIGGEAPANREGSRRLFDHCLTSDDAVALVAEAGVELVGELHVLATNGLADLGMMVRDGHRGRGIGWSLMEACLDWCRDRGVHKVSLSVWPHNAAALALYDRFGFVVEGRLRRHHRRRSGELWDAIQMGLVLDADSPGSPHPDAPESPPGARS